MAAAVILLSLAAAVMLALLITTRREIRRITGQIAELKHSDTNRLLHIENGSANRLVEEINGLLSELHENRIRFNRKSHVTEQMMTNISHDLRTPLTSAMGYLDLVQHAGLSDEEKKRELTVIEKRLQRLNELINSFFELSQIVSGGKQPELQTVNLLSVLEESIANYYEDFSGQDRKILLDSNQRKLQMRSNRSILMRIFDNLIGNALKHGTGDLTVTIRCSETIQIMFMNMLDTPRIDIEHIFDEFYTTDISRTKGNTGLGLAIAKQFTEMLDGSISAEHIGQVFTLTVSFPA